jgi:hypothetical protein
MTSTQTSRKPRTERIPDEFAGHGAVRQGGSLPVYRCTTCKREVVWATSRKTSGKYLVNVRTGYNFQRFYQGNDLHKCEEFTEKDQRALAMAHNERVGNEMLTRVQALREAGASKEEIVSVLNEYDNQWMEV